MKRWIASCNKQDFFVNKGGIFLFSFKDRTKSYVIMMKLCQMYIIILLSCLGNLLRAGAQSQPLIFLSQLYRIILNSCLGNLLRAGAQSQPLIFLSQLYRIILLSCLGNLLRAGAQSQPLIFLSQFFRTGSMTISSSGR